MAGLDPAIHVFGRSKGAYDVDPRVEPEDDEGRRRSLLTFVTVCVLVLFMSKDTDIYAGESQAGSAESPNGESPDTDSPRAAWVAGQLADLAELRQIGMEMARGIGRMKAKLSDEPSPGEPNQDEPSQETIGASAMLTLAFTRISRSVQQLVGLEQEVAGLRDPRERRLRERRNADTAKALRLIVGGLAKERIPDANPDYLKGLVTDAFRDDDDYEDYERGDMGPVVARICQRFHVDHDPAKWPAAVGSGAGPALTSYAGDDLDKRITAEMDLIAARQKDFEAWKAANGGHDPP